MNGFLKAFCCESFIKTHVFSHVFYKRRVQLVSTCLLTETSPAMDRRSLATEGMAEIHWKQTSRRNTKTSETNNLYSIPSQRPQMVVSKNGRYPQIMHFCRSFHCKPSILHTPYSRKPTTIHKSKVLSKLTLHRRNCLSVLVQLRGLNSKVLLQTAPQSEVQWSTLSSTSFSTLWSISLHVELY